MQRRSSNWWAVSVECLHLAFCRMPSPRALSVHCMHQPRHHTNQDTCDQKHWINIASHCMVLFCERYWLAQVGGRGCGWKVVSDEKDFTSKQVKMLAQSERFQASKSVGCRWGIPHAVICISRCLIWQMVCYLTLSSLLFCSNCVLWSLSIEVRMVFTTNQLVETISKLVSNTLQDD